MKNTVYALAGQTDEIEAPERFGLRLVRHFLNECAHVSSARVEISEHSWKRMKFDDGEHDHSFIRGSNEKRTAKVVATRDSETVESGVEDLVVLKSAQSGFVGFIKDQYTTLPEVSDRILATSIKSTWRYHSVDDATDETFDGIRRTILKTFAEHDALLAREQAAPVVIGVELPGRNLALAARGRFAPGGVEAVKAVHLPQPTRSPDATIAWPGMSGS